MSVSLNRRALLHCAIKTGAAISLSATQRLSAGSATAPAAGGSDLTDVRRRKLIIVVFGGGTRASESIDDPEHRHIPHLWTKMVPRGTLFTNMRVEHKVVHPNCTGEIVTGQREWDDLDWSRPVAHPTLFEIYRKQREVPDTAAWAFVYASILAGTGYSRAAGYGESFAANVVEPPTIPRSTAEDMSRLLQEAAASGSAEAEMQAAQQCERLARDTSRIKLTGLRSLAARSFIEEEYKAWKSAHGTTSHDAFLVERALSCMRRFAPSVLMVALGEIDCAHYGSWSRYVEAIRRTDELTWRLWKESQQMDEYRGRTLMMILPDHGRELESPNGPGFIHHSDFYTGRGVDEGCRRVWMLAIGTGIQPGLKIANPTPTAAAAATGLEFLGLPASPGAARSVLPLMRDRA
jgi:hypothetical protein